VIGTCCDAHEHGRILGNSARDFHAYKTFVNYRKFTVRKVSSGAGVVVRLAVENTDHAVSEHRNAHELAARDWELDDRASVSACVSLGSCGDNATAKGNTTCV
jgi:hypothetical protein